MMLKKGQIKDKIKAQGKQLEQKLMMYIYIYLNTNMNLHINKTITWDESETSLISQFYEEYI